MATVKYPINIQNTYIKSTSPVEVEKKLTSTKVTAYPQSGCHTSEWKYYRNNQWQSITNTNTVYIGAPGARPDSDTGAFYVYGARNITKIADSTKATANQYELSISATATAHDSFAGTFYLQYWFDNNTTKCTLGPTAVSAGQTATLTKTVSSAGATYGYVQLCDGYGNYGSVHSYKLTQGPAVYTLTGKFSGNGWSSTTDVTATAESGKSASVTAHSTTTNYTFSHWSSSTSTSQVTTTTLTRTLTSNETWTAYTKRKWQGTISSVTDIQPTSAKVWVSNTTAGITTYVQVAGVKYTVSNGYALVKYAMGSGNVRAELYKSGCTEYYLDYTTFDVPDGYKVSLTANDSSLFENLPYTRTGLDYGESFSYTAKVYSKWATFNYWDTTSQTSSTLSFTVYGDSSHKAYATPKFEYHLWEDSKTVRTITVRYYVTGVTGSGILYYRESGSSTIYSTNITLDTRQSTTTLTGLKLGTKYQIWITYADSSCPYTSERIEVETYGYETLYLGGPAGFTFTGDGQYEHGVTAQYSCDFDSMFYSFNGWYEGTTKISSSQSGSILMNASHSLTAKGNQRMDATVSYESLTSYKVKINYANTGSQTFAGVRLSYTIQARSGQWAESGTFDIEEQGQVCTFQQYYAKYYTKVYPYYYDLNGNKVICPYSVYELTIETEPLYTLTLKEASDSPQAFTSLLVNTTPALQPNYFEYNSIAEIQAVYDAVFYGFGKWSKEETDWSTSSKCNTDKIKTNVTYYAHGSRLYSSTLQLRAMSPHRIRVTFKTNYTGTLVILCTNNSTKITTSYYINCVQDTQDTYDISSLTAETNYTINLHCFKIVDGTGKISPYSLAESSVYLKTVSLFKWTDDDATIFVANGATGTTTKGYVLASKIEDADVGVKGKLKSIGYTGTFNYTARVGYAITAVVINEIAKAINTMPGRSHYAIGTDAEIDEKIVQGQIVYAKYFANTSTSIKEVLNEAITYFNNSD